MRDKAASSVSPGGFGERDEDGLELVNLSHTHAKDCGAKKGAEERYHGN